MGYDLIPRNKKINSFNPGIFTWPHILQETGCGYLFGYGEGRRPATYVYQPQRNNGSPVSNDGYIVSSKEAKIMHKLLIGYLSVKEFINKEWEDLAEKDREDQLSWKKIGTGGNLLQHPTGEKLLDTIRGLAEFCKQSGGFRIR